MSIQNNAVGVLLDGVVISLPFVWFWFFNGSFEWAVVTYLAIIAFQQLQD